MQRREEKKRRGARKKTKFTGQGSWNSSNDSGGGKGDEKQERAERVLYANDTAVFLVRAGTIWTWRASPSGVGYVVFFSRGLCWASAQCPTLILVGSL
jgi:hypothetical protein